MQQALQVFIKNYLFFKKFSIILDSGPVCETSLIQTTSTTTTITSASTVDCPNDLAVCKNDAQCIILNGRDIKCNCLYGFTGNQSLDLYIIN